MTTSPPSPPTQLCRFGPLEVEFDDRVLEPRPWTLLQSSWAAELDGAGPILELFAGVGHIGLAAAVLAGRDLVQVEADPVAAEFARRNAARAGFAERAELRVLPITEALGPDERFDVIVADPPYLPSGEIADWPDDPVRAIDGGPDGLDLVRACLEVVTGHLAPRGQVLLQVAGPAQAAQVRALLDSHGAALVAVEERVVDERRAVLLLARS
jgi:methylase of polypeptide subunit release factors